MDNIYIVLSIEDATVKVCETYLDETTAFCRALDIGAIASINMQIWFVEKPAFIATVDGGRWVFLETSKKYIACHKCKISRDVWSLPLNKPTLSSDIHTLNSITKTYSMPAVQKLRSGCFDLDKCGGTFNDYPICISSVNRQDQDMPGGFSFSGKAVSFSFLECYPQDVKLTTDLTSLQRKALVTARIRSISNYTFNWSSGLSWTRDHALLFVEGDHEFGQVIIEFECKYLDDYRQSRIDYYHEDESSSSSEEDSDY